MLNEYRPWPEEVDEAVLAFDVSDGFFEGGYTAAAYPKDFKKFVPESLLLSPFTRGASPIPSKFDSTITNFIPGQVRHGSGACIQDSGEAGNGWRPLCLAMARAVAENHAADS